MISELIHLLQATRSGRMWLEKHSSHSAYTEPHPIFANPNIAPCSFNSQYHNRAQSQMAPSFTIHRPAAVGYLPVCPVCFLAEVSDVR